MNRETAKVTMKSETQYTEKAIPFDRINIEKKKNDITKLKKKKNGNGFPCSKE